MNSSNKKTSPVHFPSIYVWFIILYLCQDEENVKVASVDASVRRGDSSNSSLSGDGAGLSSLGISIDVSLS